MSDGPLPQGWSRPGFFRARKLARRVRSEVPASHALAGERCAIVAVEDGGDGVVARTGRDGELFYLHLTWSEGGEATPHALGSLGELAGMNDPDPGLVDSVSLWTDARTRRRLVMAEHSLDGGETLHAIDWTAPEPPRSTTELAAMGWTEVTGPLRPMAERDGALIETGQTVEYWVRPLPHDFILLRAIETPGDAISVRNILPGSPEIFEFQSTAELETWAGRGNLRRFVSPVFPRFGVSAL
ncbi:MAG: hypothetical protein ACU0DK_09960 [Pseudooceanicola sp.]